MLFYSKDRIDQFPKRQFLRLPCFSSSLPAKLQHSVCTLTLACLGRSHHIIMSRSSLKLMCFPNIPIPHHLILCYPLPLFVSISIVSDTSHNFYLLFPLFLINGSSTEIRELAFNAVFTEIGQYPYGQTLVE